MSEWISVEDRLPDGRRDSLLWNSEDEESTIGYFLPAINRWFITENGERIEYVTHWMELPSPPSNENK